MTTSRIRRAWCLAMGIGFAVAIPIALGAIAIPRGLSARSDAYDDAGVPLNVRSPALAQDESSVVLVWDKPLNYGQVIDYRVYMDGEAIGTARQNNDLYSPAKPYIDRFYVDDLDNFHVKVQFHNFTVRGLRPDTPYLLWVTSVLTDGRESKASTVLLVRTTPVPMVFNVETFGAVGDGATINTGAIQNAIDACSPGGKVLVPAGVFKTGAIFLKSDMTFEIAEGGTLLGSENAADYPIARGYTLYDYFTDVRSPSLINALDSDHRAAGAFANIRIVGKGIIDGNGWKRTTAGSVTDEIGNRLPQWIASSSTNVTSRNGGDGILASSQVVDGIAAGLTRDSAYVNRRSSLITMRGVRNLYYAGLTMRNPANHAVVNLESANVTINGLTIETYDANNADGVEFVSGNGLIVFNTFMDTGDDCMNFAAGVGKDAVTASQSPSENAWIFDNYFREGHGAVVMGSHTGAWIQDILAEDNVMRRTDVGLRAKSTVQTGGGGRNVVFRDNAMRDISSEPFIFTLDYASQGLTFTPADAPAQFRDIVVRSATVDGSTSMSYSIQATGTAAGPGYHENLVFDNVKMRNVKRTNINYLKNSTFNDVVFTNWSRARVISPWAIANSLGLLFTGTTFPLPGEIDWPPADRRDGTVGRPERPIPRLPGHP